jgi:hypothetical protein
MKGYMSCRGMSQSPVELINHKITNKNLKQGDIIFFTEVHLLADKLVLVVAIHLLGGSRANWHHMSNP